METESLASVEITEENKVQIFKVSGKTSPKNLGHAIALTLREQETLVVQAAGKDAIANTVYGIIVARGIISQYAKDIKIVFGYDVKNLLQEFGKEEFTIIVCSLRLIPV